ncbi:MAG: hypothetical protein RLZZ175_893 [Bacteroidota bacterium]|jgi:hypothetical protein
MNNKINEDCICVLKKNSNTNQIDIDFINIENENESLLNTFSNICNTQNIENIIEFISNSKALNELNSNYRYCIKLSGHNEGLKEKPNLIEDIKKRYKIIEENKNQYDLIITNSTIKGQNDFEKNINDLKDTILNTFILWNKASSISKCYYKCQKDTSILTFSHRINGWSNPVYQLTDNFSIEIKTNFGYGKSSYFYIKLKFKEIEITPLSEWIEYEFAKFSEIIRYTQSYPLVNEAWSDVMKYSKDACNLSIINEMLFIDKYILKECEIMVNGLENILNNEEFLFKKINTFEKIKVNKEGILLIDFRGEKISGALDFINKILEYENISTISAFINRIEICNKKIQPTLLIESENIKKTLLNLSLEIESLNNTYTLLYKENEAFNHKRKLIKNEIQLIENKQVEINEIDLIDKTFNERYPEYLEFIQHFTQIVEKLKYSRDKYQLNLTLYNNFISYLNKIDIYFNKKLNPSNFKIIKSKYNTNITKLI